MRLFIGSFLAYLIGSIPTGYIFARSKNIDIRQHGSGNVGATNVLRSVGRTAAVLTLTIDVLKGFVAVTLLAGMTYHSKMGLLYTQYSALLGLCVVLGHNLSIFLKFKGGKGVATTAGVLAALCTKLLLIGLIVWVIIFAITKIVSLASLVSAISIPVASYFLPYPNAVRILVVILAVLIFISHRKNILRLIKREEKPLSVKT